MDGSIKNNTSKPLENRQIESSVIQLGEGEGNMAVGFQLLSLGRASNLISHVHDDTFNCQDAMKFPCAFGEGVPSNNGCPVTTRSHTFHGSQTDGHFLSLGGDLGDQTWSMNATRINSATNVGISSNPFTIPERGNVNQNVLRPSGRTLGPGGKETGMYPNTIPYRGFHGTSGVAIRPFSSIPASSNANEQARLSSLPLRPSSPSGNPNGSFSTPLLQAQTKNVRRISTTSSMDCLPSTSAARTFQLDQSGSTAERKMKLLYNRYNGTQGRVEAKISAYDDFSYLQSIGAYLVYGSSVDKSMGEKIDITWVTKDQTEKPLTSDIDWGEFKRNVLIVKFRPQMDPLFYSLASTCPATPTPRRGKKLTLEGKQHYKTIKAKFFKLRTKLLNEATKICTFDGAEIGIILFSPAGEACTFGYPSLNLVLDRFLDQDEDIDDLEQMKREIEQLKDEDVNDMELNELEEMKKKIEELKSKVEAKLDEQTEGTTDDTLREM